MATDPSMEAHLKEMLAAPPPRRESPSHYSPRPQPYHAFDNESGLWQKQPAGSSTHASPLAKDVDCQRLRILTWNIDCLIPYSVPRMRAALNHVHSLISASPLLTVVLLQEMTFSDIQLIKASPWIRERFFITDADHGNWASGLYGTTALVDKRLGGMQVFRVPWVSKFHRDGLFIDLQVTADDSAGAEGSERKVFRLCNAHLESLVADPPVRPGQMADAAEYLHKAYAGLVAGDMNAIEPFDRTLPAENGLKDAYLELGGIEGHPIEKRLGLGVFATM